MALKEKGKTTKSSKEEVVVDTTNANGTEETGAAAPAPKTAPESGFFSNSVGMAFISDLQNTYGVYNGIGTTVSIDELLKTPQDGQSVQDFIASDKVNLKMTILDKAVDNNLLYSFPILYRECDDHIKYAPLLLTGTGRKPLTAFEYSTKAEAATRNPDLKADVYTYASALNDVIDTKAAAKLRTVIDAKSINKDLLTFNGKVVNTDLDLKDAIGIMKKAIADTAVEFGVDDGFSQMAGLNIAKLKGDGNVRFRYAIEINKDGTIVDKLGSPVRADFTCHLYIDTGANVRNWKLNEGALTQELLTFSGYFTGVPNYIAEHRDQSGQTVPGAYVVSPRLIITNISCLYPDLPSTLLGIATSYLLFTEKQYVKIIHDTMTADNHPGVFNILTKWATDAKGQAGSINLLDKKYNEQQRLEVIDNIFKGTPIISVDVKLFGTDFNNLEIIKASRDERSALTDVSNAASILTDGAVAINQTPVFALQKQPAGYYFDAKNRQKDIRDWEIERYLGKDTMLQDQTAYELMMQAMVLNAGSVSYGNKIDVLSSYFKDRAYIDGEIERLTISPEFLSQILSGLKQAGFYIAGDERYVYIAQNFGFNHNYVNGYNMDIVSTDIGRFTGGQPQGWNTYIWHNPFVVSGYTLS